MHKSHFMRQDHTINVIFFLCISFLIFLHQYPEGCFSALALFKAKTKYSEINIEGNFHLNARKKNLGSIQINAFFFLFFRNYRNREKHQRLHVRSAPFTLTFVFSCFGYKLITKEMSPIPYSVHSGPSLGTLPPTPEP